MDAPKFQCNQSRRAQCKLSNDTEDRGCARNQTRCNSDLSDKDGDWIPCCEKQNLLQIVEFIDRVLCGHVSYTLAYGSLLAGVRERDLIDWDTDVDIIVNERDMEITKRLFKAHPEDFDIGTGSEPMRIYWGENNSVHADIWFAKYVGNCLVADGAWFPTAWYKTPYTHQCILQGRRFPCPAAYKEILGNLYGDGNTTSHSWWDAASGKGGGTKCEVRENCTVEENGFECTDSELSLVEEERERGGEVQAQETEEDRGEEERDAEYEEDVEEQDEDDEEDEGDSYGVQEQDEYNEQDAGDSYA
jgi:hypothetical protein